MSFLAFCIFSQVSGSGACLFEAILLQLDHPLAFTSHHLRLMMVHFMASNASVFVEAQGAHIQGLYGLQVAEGEEAHDGPFSFKQYMRHVMQQDKWGDAVCLVALSMLFSAKITIVDVREFVCVPIRHGLEVMRGVDMAVLYNGASHYSAIREYFFCS
jgi:hypothetical protein